MLLPSVVMTEPRTDLELLSAWREGDSAAGSRLFDRHFAALYRFFAGKVGSAADDLVQQTMLACLRWGAGFRGEASFRAYLFAIARRELFAHLTRRERDPARIDFTTTSLRDLGTTPSEVVARKSSERMLLAALQCLPLEQQIVVELYFFEELRGEDLVAALGIPPGTVRSRIRLALERLRREIERIEREPRSLASSLHTIGEWARQLHDDRD
jgi:RNA polymerase sigma factor (sigma-70 family)